MNYKISTFLYKTERNFSADSEVLSHKLMLRSGYVSAVAAGVFIWQPMGLRVLDKVTQIVRKQLVSDDVHELLMPVLQPAQMWQQSGRYDLYGKELMRLTDRHDNAYCLGPTHEEVIVLYVKSLLKSFKQLPFGLFQIQTKMRDEVRPRFGVIRSREFVMKDAYSFHANDDCMQRYYDKMHNIYCRIYDAIGLDYVSVRADSGSIGGSASEEFHALADIGEDAIAFSDQSVKPSQFAANLELAPSYSPKPSNAAPLERQILNTPNCQTIEQVSEFLSIAVTQCVKSMIATDGQQLFAIILRGDHTLSLTKFKRQSGLDRVELATPVQIIASLGNIIGSIGPINLSIPLYVDHFATAVTNFCCGANVAGQHYINANWSTDVTNYEVGDFRVVEAGEPCADASGSIVIKRGIEVGHIFQLGDKYSAAMDLTIPGLSDRTFVKMGCYGIGVSRIVAAAIEQFSNSEQLILPKAIAPFDIAILPINFQKSESVRFFCNTPPIGLFNNFDCLLFDNGGRMGELIKDFQLSGIPVAIIVGEKDLANAEVTVLTNQDQRHTVKIDNLIQYLKTL